ncbi:UvrD-helicase domain-containing protein [Thermoanaerobacterium sp. RBIITD]|uniref:UvrD-helicase domain-containing protein n=1 Tax=Thermoanaerobacterium sp. RBIITD TaxID=1550240 RepID=UPI000BB859D8|nr:UvrD-helicase domain-containing protein [Thermoanaerobacterium sp. RBIITD]SNX54886.1 Superfamily I DNA or RNA helicase [Thermoanaerobacterium sp. RBIITD]
MIDNICREYDVNTEQAEALDIHKNIALKAGAGSGKTRVLTKRYLRLLNEVSDIKIDNIVAITFTKKAASEMKERIRKEISLKAKNADSIERKKWVEFEKMISLANIDTIHGFCEKMLRDNFAKSGLDPLFTIIDESESETAICKYTKMAIEELIDDPKYSQLLTLIMSKYSSSLIRDGILEMGLINLLKHVKEIGMDLNDLKCNIDNIDHDATNALEAMALKLVKVIDKKYSIFKHERNLLDFNDLEIYTEKLLSDEDIRESYFNRYKYILVDEFQDINQIQKRILLRLTLKNGIIPPGRLFIVGDHKQSIYGFRGTDYRILEEFCDIIKENGEILNLCNCYRSTKNIINTVNSVFENLLKPYEELKYIDDNDISPKVELITLKKENIKDKSNERFLKIKKLLPDESKDKELYDALMQDIEKGILKKDYQGEIIAGRILNLIKEGFSYKDIAILIRSRNGLDTIENALLKYKIPYCIIGGIGFWDNPEIIDIISLYKLVFDISDKIALLTVLRSPIFCFSDDNIYNLMRIYNKNQRDNILDAIKELIDVTENDKRWIIKRAYTIFKDISRLYGAIGAYDIFKEIISITNYKNLLISLPNGFQKLRNIEKLEKIIKDYTEKDIFSARDLISYLDSLEETSSMDSEAFLDTEESDAVKILTIHASKGLEFEAVIIPDMDKSIDSISKRQKPLFLLSDDGCINAIGLNDNGELDKDVNPQYKEAYENLLNKENQESRRIFYVAATRAKRFLAFVGELKEERKRIDLDREPILNSFMKQLFFAMERNKLDINVIDGDGLLQSISSDEGIQKKLNEDLPLSIIERIDKAAKNDLIRNIPLEPKGNISITTYMDFCKCPKLYYYKYIASLNDDYKGNSDDMKDIGEFDSMYINAIDRGTIVHKVLENIREIDELQKSNLITDQLNRFENENKLKESIRKYIDNYFKIEKNMKLKSRGKLLKCLREYHFRVPINKNLNLNGVIDRIDIYENNENIEAYIYDYKTNKINNDEDMKKVVDYYKKQICAYSYALNKLNIINGYKPILKCAYLYLLDCAKYAEVNIDDSSIYETLREIIKASPYLLGIKKFEDYNCIKSDNCILCNFKRIC